MSMDQENIGQEAPGRGQGEEDLGIFGPPVTETTEQRARRLQYAKMAANMIITDEPRGNYFVRRPGL